MDDDVKRRTFEVNVLCGRRRPSAGIGGPHLSLMAEPLMKATAPIFASAIPIANGRADHDAMALQS